MKIGMITLHESQSLGASLQACALGHALTELDHEPMIVDYKPDYLTSIYDPLKPGVKNALRRAMFGSSMKEKRENFIRFKEQYHPPMTTRILNRDGLRAYLHQFDAFVCGSDQIWNPPHMHYDDSFFLSFVPYGVARRISYAPSIGMDVLSEKDRAFLKKNLQYIDALSVREDSAAALLKELTGRQDIVQVVDPTFLLNADAWRAIQRPVARKLPDRYLLYYPLSANPQADGIIAGVKEKTGLPCLCIGGGLHRPKGADIMLSDIGPQELLYLYDKADLVVTNSFHGAAFAINYRKKMVIYRHLERNCRMESMLRLFRIIDCQVTDAAECNTRHWEALWTDGFKAIDSILPIEREKAYGFLREALNGRDSNGN